MAPRVFLITGTSTGFGSEYVKEILAKGDKVVATSRKSSTLSFDGTNSDNYLALDLDVTSKDSIAKAFKAALDKFGRIDVVCNNAGYGLCGEFESLSERQIRTQMEVNFFGLANVTRIALETLRDQKPSGGMIQQVTSIGGQTGVPMFSVYNASKWAVEGFTEAIAQELKPEWGIKVQCIEPGGFRTNWAGQSMAFGEEKCAAYDHLDAEKTMGERNGKQAGDPVKAGKAFYELAVMDDPPLRCIVGSDAYTRLNQKIDQYVKNIERMKDLTNSTDVDGYVRPQ
ncbi:MAG: hypothetical protein M1820_004585 [Bogoriella megaspora]|nr:MAG: hypothetical protein M1820_004585 [Bogoriella megaspora]